MTTHFDVIQENIKRDVSVVYEEEKGKIETKTDCRILHLDSAGVTFVDKAKLGKNRVTFIPAFRLVMIRQELM